jgi:hypothetical protein
MYSKLQKLKKFFGKMSTVMDKMIVLDPLTKVEKTRWLKYLSIMNFLVLQLRRARKDEKSDKELIQKIGSYIPNAMISMKEDVDLMNGEAIKLSTEDKKEMRNKIYKVHHDLNLVPKRKDSGGTMSTAVSS